MFDGRLVVMSTSLITASLVDVQGCFDAFLVFSGVLSLSNGLFPFFGVDVTKGISDGE